MSDDHESFAKYERKRDERVLSKLGDNDIT